ncbi:hypothetical protein [Kiloniella laminariae]|uniref:hypothetical protein n=1 Tax=Kiloniella laminariae TaxID=454162 RepID=UPI000376E3C4|nr:hypothetical protein [Kiloniella laminariae]
MMIRKSVVWVVALFIAGAGCLVLPSGESGVAQASQSQSDILEDVVQEVEKAIINRYFGKEDTTYSKSKKQKGKQKGLPPGLAKKGSLPPGLQKHLDENGSLPRGLAKRDLPDDLLSRLPKRKNTKFIRVDDDVVLIDILTNKALDVIEGVLK